MTPGKGPMTGLKIDITQRIREGPETAPVLGTRRGGPTLGTGMGHILGTGPVLGATRREGPNLETGRGHNLGTGPVLGTTRKGGPLGILLKEGHVLGTDRGPVLGT